MDNIENKKQPDSTDAGYLKDAEAVFLAMYPGLPVDFLDMLEESDDPGDRIPYQFIAEVSANNGTHAWFYNEGCLRWEYDCFTDIAGERIKVAEPTFEALREDFGDKTAFDMMGKLKKAAEHIIKEGAGNTVSGDWIADYGDLPGALLTPVEFSRHIGDIANMMMDYEAVAEAEAGADGSLHAVFYLDYCPNYEPMPSEEDDYPDSREIAAPLLSKKVRNLELGSAEHETVRKIKKSIYAALDEGKAKAAKADAVRAGQNKQASRKRGGQLQGE